MKDESNPISIRLSELEANKLKEIGGGKSVAAGVKELLRLYGEGGISGESSTGVDELKALEAEIKGLKDSPFGFDKKEITMLERELEKAKAKFKDSKVGSLRERILGLVKSTG